MSANNDDQPSSSFQAKRGLLIGCLLLFLAGGLYWFYTTPISTPPVPAAGTPPQPTVSAAEAPQPASPEEKTAEDTPEVTENSVTTDSRESAGPAAVKAVPTERTAPKRSFKPAPDNVEPTASPARVVASPAVPTPVEKPVVVAAPPVAVPVAKPEAAPVTKPAIVATTPAAKPAAPATTAKAKSGIPGELKPVAQPAPPPATVSAAPALKRKTKNDEDVEVDFK